ncbi:hypothetical protein AAG906_013030 [Vitis piasezkii]
MVSWQVEFRLVMFRLFVRRLSLQNLKNLTYWKFYFLFGGSEVKHELMVALWDDKLLKLVLKQHMTSMRQFLDYDELRIRWVDLGLKKSNFTRLCSTKSMLTVNESFSGLVIPIHRGDKVYVYVQNEGDYAVTIHWR